MEGSEGVCIPLRCERVFLTAEEVVGKGLVLLLLSCILLRASTENVYCRVDPTLAILHRVMAFYIEQSMHVDIIGSKFTRANCIR